MTDKDIIKALECCANGEECHICPLSDEYADCRILPNALDLIKKLKNREKKYQKKVKFQRSALRRQQEEIENARAEAIKEFAEKLHNRMINYYDCLKNANKSNYNGETLMNYEVAEMIEDCIDDLVKEMVGGE